MKLAIIHFSPIELYPPVMNWLNYLASSLPDGSEVRVYTMEPSPEFERYVTPSSKIILLRSDNSWGRNFFARYWKYFGFYMSVSRKLNSWKPNTLMYYETLSAFPAFIHEKVL